MTKRALPEAALAALLSLTPMNAAEASSIPMPAGSRTWILIGAGDCDDDGPNVNVDRGHCAGSVSPFDQPGDIGHDIYQGYQIFADGVIGAEAFHGSAQTTGGGLFAFMDMSMIDTYTLNSGTLPAGTVVPITVTFQASADMIPEGLYTNTGVLIGWGGGAFTIRIGNYFIPDPIVIPENARVNGPFGAAASAQFYQYPSPGPATVPIELTATASLDVTIGTPFDLAYYLGARPAASRIDFSHTASISFTVPNGTILTSTGGYGGTVPVQQKSWGALKARYN